MLITTTRFGNIDVAAGDVIRFPGGLPGLEDCRDWALLADAANDAVGWLQSTTRGDVALAVVSPRRFVPDYRARIPRSELQPLGLADIRDAQVVVVAGRIGTTLMLNLKAPIVINVETRRGRQVVASGDLPLRHEVLPGLPPVKRSA